jgi:hypothetical protein
MLIAFTISVILAFIDKIPRLHRKEVYYVLCVIVGAILLSNTYNDYGMMLLIIALLVMVHGLESAT